MRRISAVIAAIILLGIFEFDRSAVRIYCMENNKTKTETAAPAGYYVEADEFLNAADGFLNGTDDYYNEFTPYFQNTADWYDGNSIRMPVDNETWQENPIYLERCAMCAVPQEVLDNASTHELARLVIECPLGRLIVTQRGTEEGMKLLWRDFNGFRELLEREDCGETILEIYDAYNIPEEKAFDYSMISDEWTTDEFNEQIAEIFGNEEYLAQVIADSQTEYTVALCEWILAYESASGQIEPEDAADVILSKKHEKATSEFADCLDNYFIRKTNEASETDSPAYSAAAADVNGGDVNTVIYTPGGNALTITYVSNPSVLSYEASVGRLGDYAKYLNQYVFLLENGTARYNCHAYAWFRMLAGRYYQYATSCQVNVPDALEDDKYIHKSSTLRRGGVISGNGHSAYVEVYDTQYHNNGYGPCVTEKLSSGGPLVRWPLAYSMASGGNVSYYYYLYK